VEPLAAWPRRPPRRPRSLAECLARELPLILAHARPEHTEALVAVAALLVGRQKLAPQKATQQFGNLPVLCNQYPVVRSVVDAAFVRAILANSSGRSFC
jgi:hypothetical protein